MAEEKKGPTAAQTQKAIVAADLQRREAQEGEEPEEDRTSRAGRTEDDLAATIQDTESRTERGPAVSVVAANEDEKPAVKLYEVLHANVAGHAQGSRVSLVELGIAPRAGSSITEEDSDRYLKRLMDLGAVREYKAPADEE